LRPCFRIAGPDQLRHPSGTATGTAYLTVFASDGAISTGSVEVSGRRARPVQRRLQWPRAGGGSGFTVRGSSSQWSLAFQCDTQGRNCSTQAIDLGGDTDDVFLVLYGTGIRNRSVLSAVTCTVGGVPASRSTTRARKARISASTR